jgi:hypothetical protein
MRPVLPLVAALRGTLTRGILAGATEDFLHAALFGWTVWLALFAQVFVLVLAIAKESLARISCFTAATILPPLRRQVLRIAQLSFSFLK